MSDPPVTVEPAHDYLGFLCELCGQNFSIVGPLDPVAMPPDQPVRIGAQNPLHARCTHCGHEADYTIQQLIRFSN